MKKVLFFAGLAAAALSLVGCNKETDVKGLDARPVEIILSQVDTRTVNNGMATLWANQDELNVFYAPAGTETYSSNAKFVVDDAAANHATGTAELTADAYDWYLLYPYEAKIKTPANTGSGYLAVGCQSNKTQTQAGLDNMAHLAGKNLPVYGVAKNIPVDEVPTVSMKHVASVVAVNVTNGTDKPLAVSSVSFTAPEDIVGTYYINFAGEKLSFKGSGNNYVDKTATLDVTGDETIAAGASAKFYLAIKPFEAKAGDALTLKIMAGESVFEKEITLPSAVEFKSGFIKTLNIEFTGGSEIQSSSLAEVIGMSSGTDIVTSEALVVGKYARGIMLAQEGTYLLAYSVDGVDAAIGDIVTVAGKVGSYNGLKQINSPVATVVSSGNEVVLPDPKVLEKLDSYASSKVELIQFSGTLRISGSYYNVEVAGSSTKGSIQYPIDTEAMTALKDKPITATGFFTGCSGTSTKYVNMMSTSIEEREGPVFEVTPSQIDVDATATSAEITVTANVDWTATTESEDVTVNPASGSGNGTITVTFPANEDPESVKEYAVIITTDNVELYDAGLEELVVYITQAKAASVEPQAYPYEETFAESKGEFTIEDVNRPSDLSYIWTYDTHKYMKASAFINPTNYDAESWLISPLVDLATAENPVLTFTHATNFFSSVDKAKEEATVWVRVQGGEWTALEGVNYPTSMSWSFVEAGPVDLSAYVGKIIQIGFKYVSTATKSGTWEIKNFKLDEAPTGPVDPTFTVTPTLILEEGETAKINVTTDTDGDITFTSANEAVATVAADGTVTAVAAGNTTITVSAAATDNFNAASASVAVTVTEVDNTMHTITISDYQSTSFTAGVYSIVAEKAGASNAPSYNATAKDLRVYAKGTLTVSNSKENITKIIFHLSAQGLKRLPPITASTGTIAPQAERDTKVIWTGDAAEVVFTVGEKANYGTDGSGSAGQLCFDAMDVAPWSDGDVQPKTLSSISVSGQKTIFTVGDDFSFGGTITAEYSDGSHETVAEADATFAGYDMSQKGEQTVTVTYETVSTSYQITVNEKVSGESWTRVTSVEELLAGGTFIIGYEATAKSGVIIPMANTGSATTSAAGFMYSGSTATSGGTETIDMSSVSNPSPFVVTITASTVVSGAVNIMVGDNYLGNTDTRNNCKLFAEESATTAFTPTVGDNDVFTLKIAANENYNSLQYNSGSPRFAVYNGGQKNVVIYKK